MLTTYNTTLLANGSDHTRLRIAITDSLSREITSAEDTIHLYVTGKGKVTAADRSELPVRKDSTGIEYSVCRLDSGTYHLIFTAGTKPDKIKVEARSGRLWPDGHISNPNQLAALLMAGNEGVRAVDPEMPVMIHIALGG